MAKKKKPKKDELQSLKVAVSKTLRTRVVKSKKVYTRKMKHHKAHFPFLFSIGRFLLLEIAMIH